MTQLLSELREPPVVGTFYMVPFVASYGYCGVTRDWPVLGPKHNDAEFFAFKDAHYHVDLRFVPASVSQRLARFVPRHYSTPEAAVAGFPLANRSQPLPNGRPALKRMRCVTTQWEYPFPHRIEIQNIRARYGDPAPAIMRPDGRLLCPHRKVDLSQFVPDADGVITCPLHGLRVCAREPSNA